MGTRGPVPKRSSERRRQNKDSQSEKITLGSEPVVAPDPDPLWHPIAADWFRSLGESGQSRFFEPSDWQAARYLAEAMSRNLGAGAKFSAVLFASVWSAMADLLTTEGARRRARVEIERAPDDVGVPSEVTALDAYRRDLGLTVER